MKDKKQRILRKYNIPFILDIILCVIYSVFTIFSNFLAVPNRPDENMAVNS